MSLDAELVARLRAAAEAAGVSESELIRTALTERAEARSIRRVSTPETAGILIRAIAIVQSELCVAALIS